MSFKFELCFCIIFGIKLDVFVCKKGEKIDNMEIVFDSLILEEDNKGNRWLMMINYFDIGIFLYVNIFVIYCNFYIWKNLEVSLYKNVVMCFL